MNGSSTTWQWVVKEIFLWYLEVKWILGVTSLSLLFLLQLHSDKKQISVGFIGYPNVGKSSIINTLKAKKVCKVAPLAGETKVSKVCKLALLAGETKVNKVCKVAPLAGETKVNKVCKIATTTSWWNKGKQSL